MDSRIESQFEEDKKGQRAAYSDLMRGFRPGSLLYKNVPMPKRKRFAVANMEAMRNTQNKTVQESTPQKLLNNAEKAGSSAAKLVTQSSEDRIGSGIAPGNDKAREKQVKEAYANTKNYSGINNNYSYRI